MASFAFTSFSPTADQIPTPHSFSASAVDSLIADQRNTFSSTLAQLDAIIEQLKPNSAELVESASADSSSAALNSSLNAFRSSSLSAYRSLFSRSSDLSSALNSLTKSASATLDEICDASPHINTAAAESLIERAFLIQGDVAAAETLRNEMKSNETNDFPEKFREFHRIRDSLNNGDVASSLVWCQSAAVHSASASPENSDFSTALSNFCFDLHRIKFLDLLTKDPNSALKYAQTEFPRFAATRLDEIRQVSSALLIGSPASQQRKFQLAASELFTDLYCRVINFHPVDPLWIGFQASEAVIPQLIRRSQILKSHGASGILADSSASSGLVELELGENFLFHSTFVCPVIREPCDSDDEPVVLQCGHLISSRAVERIVKNLRVSRKFKCPTCPREQTNQEIKTVNL